MVLYTNNVDFNFNSIIGFFLFNKLCLIRRLKSAICIIYF